MFNISQKMNGLDGNGTNVEFSIEIEEAKTLKAALNDLADRIRICADKL